MYGGRHHNGVTEMALRVFADASYLELISTIEPGPQPSVWRAHIEHDGGPCGWSLGSDDLDAVRTRAASLGIPAPDPVRQHRRRADGKIAEWEVLHLGGGEPGAVYPVYIKDMSPRDIRVPTDHADAGPTSITAIALVVIGVASVEPARHRLEKLLGLANGDVLHDQELEADVVVYDDAPVAIATPSGEGWLSRRIERLGESPCAYLFSVRDLSRATDHFSVLSTVDWLRRPVAWMNPTEIHGNRIGLTS
jgi:hypothetical protein